MCQEKWLKKNISGPMLKNIQSHLNLTCLNNGEHKHLDKRIGNTDILDMAFISPNLTKHDIQFLIGDDLGSDRLPIEISTDAQPHRNIHTNPIRYKFDQTDRDEYFYPHKDTDDCRSDMNDGHNLVTDVDSILSLG